MEDPFKDEGTIHHTRGEHCFLLEQEAMVLACNGIEWEI